MQYRQDLRNLERLVTWEGIIGRKQRTAFNGFLAHPDPRIRSYAEELTARDAKARSQRKLLEDEDYCESEDHILGFKDTTVEACPGDLCSQNEKNGLDDDDIPF